MFKSVVWFLVHVVVPITFVGLAIFLVVQEHNQNRINMRYDRVVHQVTENLNRVIDANNTVKLVFEDQLEMQLERIRLLESQLEELQLQRAKERAALAALYGK